jgi:hypothetical protein
MVDSYLKDSSDSISIDAGGGGYISFGGGGGGRVSIPTPIIPYVPIRAIQFNPLNINLTADGSDALEFSDNGVVVTYGTSATVTYNPSTTFGSKRTYTAQTSAGRVVSKFDVSIIPLNDNNIQSEGVFIQESTYSNGEWVAEQPRTLNYAIGGVTLNFKLQKATVSYVEQVTESPNPDTEYELGFASNLSSEINDSISLKYEVVSNNDIIKSGILKLSDGSFIGILPKQTLSNAVVNLQIQGNLPSDINITGIYSGVKSQIGEDANNVNYDRLVKQPYAFQIPANQLTSTLVVIIKAEKVLTITEPTIELDSTQYTLNVKESDTEKSITIPFKTNNADKVLVYVSPQNILEIPASDNQISLFFQKDFQEVYGSKRIIVVPVGDKYGTGTRKEILVTFTSVNDYPSITEVTSADAIDVPSFCDFNIEYDVKYSTFAATSVDIFLKLKDGSNVGLAKNQPANGSLKVNLRTLRNTYPNWSGSDNVTLILKPYNRGGAEELIGNEYEIITKLTLPSISLDEDIIATSLFQSFSEKLNIIEPEKESKYLTHLANFGNNEQTLISSWEVDNWTLSDREIDELGNEFVKKEVESIILKLYSPLPSNITNNSTFWITKMMSNPLIETVVLNEQDDLTCPPLKGPNFEIPVDFVKGNSTNYESLDNLILGTSIASSSELVNTYLSSSLVNTDALNIEYVNGSTYLWNNFIHFSSAKERLDNFVYKVQLIESYEQLILSASTDYTGEEQAFYTSSLVSQQESERQLSKKNQLITGFDGFEKFLYTSSSMSWPYNGSNRLPSNDTNVADWYDVILEDATIFDSNNMNWVQNNIPQYIVNNEENASLLLFFSMIGQHFDNIYFHTKAIEKSRGLGYQSKDGISDKLLFDALKSFGWDAQNLAADKALWSYVFGNENGETELNPAKQRTYEVWRRIINNLPYLLKHKGTRRGVYALLSCYGIPSSNLSILEFGGPEVTETTKTKLVMDNITTALKMISGSYITTDWRDTERNRRPDTIEMFVKPLSRRTSTLLSLNGSSVGLSLHTSSNDADNPFGYLQFNYGASNFTSSILPIFNGNFFGVEISREVSGSYHNFELNVRQANKERTIFQNTTTASVVDTDSDWENPTQLKIGGTYVGSLDEFRLWSTPLQKERFFEHVSFPEMVNGNHVSASTDDLYFRLDFEYPKNLSVSQSLLNVDANIFYSSSLYRNDLESGSLVVGDTISSVNPSASYSASAFGFTSITDYPYQFEAIDRSVVLEIPDLGAGRYSTNKVRMESQTLISDLSSKGRATKKAFDQSPTDSNRVGLFFSPTKELNIDIAKSFGGINLDNYIGDPSDAYKSNYKQLDDLRSYYFERFDGRDIYAYINLIKLYEKSMFEDIKKMLPARVKATTGLLIEPHFLERSKVQLNKPTGEEYQKETNIKFSDTTVIRMENNQYEMIVNADLSDSIVGENNQYESLVDANLSDSLTATNYQYDSLIEANDDLVLSSDVYQRETTINAGLGEPTILTEIDLVNSNTIAGQSVLENIGFGIYAQGGSAIRTYFGTDGSIIKERVRVNLVTEQKTRQIVKYAVTSSVTGLGDERGGSVLTSSVYTETTLNIQPFTNSVAPIVKNNIISVVPVNGYLKTHFRNTSDLTRGMENSFFKGSKNTAATTLDGSSPVEVFTTNPNTLKVNKAGRDSSEPILEVE